MASSKRTPRAERSAFTRSWPAGASVRHSLRWLQAALLRLALCIVCLVATRPIKAEAPTREGAPLRVTNRFILELQGPVAGYSARERVDEASLRIDSALGNSKQPPKLSLLDTEYGTRILVNDQPVFLVTNADVDRQIGETPHLVAEHALIRLRRAIAERITQSTRGYFMRAALKSAAATLAYLIAMLILSRVSLSLTRFLAATAAGSVRKLHPDGMRLIDLERILRWIRALIVMAAWFIRATLTVSWLAFCLSAFPFTRPWGEGLSENLLSLAKEGILTVMHALPEVGIVVAIAFLARLMVSGLRWFSDRVEEGRIRLNWLDVDSVRPTRKIATFVIWAFALVMAYPYLPGSDTEAFKGLSVLVGLMASLGGSSLVGQTASGLTIMYAKTIRVGDYVRVAESEGTVIAIGMVATRLRTGLGEEIVIPNSTVMGNTLKNYSRVFEGKGYVLDTTVTVGYGTPWRQVHAILLEAAGKTPDVVATPAPIVRQTALSDFYVEYRLAAYTTASSPDVRVEILSGLHANIQDAFNRYGVQIMSPHYFVDPPHSLIIKEQDWFKAPSAPAETDAAEPPSNKPDQS